MNGDPFTWERWVDDCVPWFYVAVPTPAEGCIWLPALYASAEAMAQRLKLPGNALGHMIHAAGEAMARLPYGASPHCELVTSVAASVTALEKILT